MGLFPSLLNHRYLTKQWQEVKQTLKCQLKGSRVSSPTWSDRRLRVPLKGPCPAQEAGRGHSRSREQSYSCSVSLYRYSSGFVEPPKKGRQKPGVWFGIAASLGIPSSSASSLTALASLRKVCAGGHCWAPLLAGQARTPPAQKQGQLCFMCSSHIYLLSDSFFL